MPRSAYANSKHGGIPPGNYRPIFDDGVVPFGTSKPRLEAPGNRRGAAFTAAGIEVLPIGFEHGRLEVLGFRVGPVAYVTDVKAVPAAASSSRGSTPWSSTPSGGGSIRPTSVFPRRSRPPAGSARAAPS
ncbi:MAG: hypothetical protein R2882_13070 [Gemmatimonadales bacterium]